MNFARFCGLAVLLWAMTGGLVIGQEIKTPTTKAAGRVINGLQLSLSADKTEAIISKDGKIEKAVTLKLTFTNVSDKAIKLNAFDFHFSRIKGEVKAMPADSVKIAIIAADRKPIFPKAGDFPEIKPSETWSYDKHLEFPGSIPEGGSTFAQYTVVKPGEFRIKFTHNSPKINNPFANGIWTGELDSNEIVITIKEAMPPKSAKGDGPTKIRVQFSEKSVQPESDLPKDARKASTGPDANPGAFSKLVDGRISTVSVTFFDPKALKGEKDTENFLRRLLTTPKGVTHNQIPWAQRLGVPTVAATVQHTQGKAGVWLVWDAGSIRLLWLQGRGRSMVVWRLVRRRDSTLIWAMQGSKRLLGPDHFSPNIAPPIHTPAVSIRSSFTATFNCDSEDARFRRYALAESAIVTRAAPIMIASLMTSRPTPLK
jgi:hypothetical protein